MLEDLIVHLNCSLGGQFSQNLQQHSQGAAWREECRSIECAYLSGDHNLFCVKMRHDQSLDVLPNRYAFSRFLLSNVSADH
jgi:hypothetical protein